MTAKTLKQILILLEENAKQQNKIDQKERMKEHNLEEDGVDKATVEGQRK